MAQTRSFIFPRRKKDTKPELSSEITALKPDPELEIATKMIEKEHELEKNPSAKVVHELISIYTEAIEYYSHKNNQKYLDLKIRMQNIIKRPDVLQALKSEATREQVRKSSTKVVESSSSPILKKDPIESPIIQKNDRLGLDSANPNNAEEDIKEITKNSPNDLEKEVNEDSKESEPSSPAISKEPNYITSKSTSSSLPHLPAGERLRISERLGTQLSGKNLGIIIDRHSTTNKNTANRAANDFKSQETALQRRLASRQKIKMNNSMSFSSCNLNDSAEVFKCDISEVLEFNEASTKTSCFVVEEQLDECERFEKMLEEILEINYCERAKKIADIKVKYEVQINEMNGMGDLMKIVVEQMKKSMKDEIDNVVFEFDKKKKEDIAALKSGYV